MNITFYRKSQSLTWRKNCFSFVVEIAAGWFKKLMYTKLIHIL